MGDDPPIIVSPLCGPFTKDGVTVDVQIYRLEDTEWTLEVVDQHGTSTVWHDPFATDRAAQMEFLRTVDEEGMLEFCTAPSRSQH